MADRSMRKQILRISEDLDGFRIDKALAEMSPDFSRNFIQKLIGDGAVRIGDKTISDKKHPVHCDDLVELTVPEPSVIDVEAQDIPLDIIYEDEDLLVVNKPAGMVVHPAAGNPDATLVNALVYRYRNELSSINGVLRPGIVHRIDKDTSGLLMVARNDRAHESLSKQLAEHSITRKYRAIVLDNIREDAGTIDSPIGRDPTNRLRFAVSASGKSAVTHYRVEERFGRYTLVEAILETGRTHQIRVHMASIKHPLLGDTLYGPDRNRAGASRQMLHAGILGFTHPTTSERMNFRCEPPEDFIKVLEKLRSGRN